MNAVGSIIFGLLILFLIIVLIIPVTILVILYLLFAKRTTSNNLFSGVQEIIKKIGAIFNSQRKNKSTSRNQDKNIEDAEFREIR